MLKPEMHSNVREDHPAIQPGEHGGKAASLVGLELTAPSTKGREAEAGRSNNRDLLVGATRRAPSMAKVCESVSTPATTELPHRPAHSGVLYLDMPLVEISSPLETYLVCRGRIISVAQPRCYPQTYPPLTPPRHSPVAKTCVTDPVGSR